MNPIDVAFSPTVKSIQTRKGSRQGYANMAAKESWSSRMSEEVQAFIADRNSAYLGTVSAEGQPYIQHRGGPRGFLRVLDERTIAFADFKGNRQYISQGNLQDNAKAFLFLTDYSVPRRLKIWGQARIVENDPELLARLMPEDYKARAEQALVFTVDLWDFNCRQHLPLRFDAEDVAAALDARDRRIAELEDTVASLRAGTPAS